MSAQVHISLLCLHLYVPIRLSYQWKHVHVIFLKLVHVEELFLAIHSYIMCNFNLCIVIVTYLICTRVCVLYYTHAEYPSPNNPHCISCKSR